METIIHTLIENEAEILFKVQLVIITIISSLQLSLVQISKTRKTAKTKKPSIPCILYKIRLL